MKKMCYLLTMGLLAGSLTVPVFAASDADSASDKKWVIATDTVFKPFEYTDDDGNFVGIDEMYLMLSRKTRDLNMN